MISLDFKWLLKLEEIEVNTLEFFLCKTDFKVQFIQS